MELKDILNEIMSEINLRFKSYRKNFFKLGKVKIDRNNNTVDTQIIPYFQNDDMNLIIHLFINFNSDEIELRCHHKYNSIRIMYKRYIHKVPEKKERESTGFKQLDNWLNIVDKKLTVYYNNPLYDKMELVDMFMEYKDYFLSCEKYFEAKAISDKLYEKMKQAEYNI